MDRNKVVNHPIIRGIKNHKSQLFMSPRTKEQFDEIRTGSKARIMQAALEVFSEEGFDKASISKIAGRAGVSKGLMYNYFKSKEELIKTIFIDALNKLMGGFDNDPVTLNHLLRNIRGKKPAKLFDDSIRKYC
jgi:AcrR family transcriptional regulator